MFHVKNFSQRVDVSQFDRPLKANGLKRWRWLLKPLNAVLRWLSATWVDETKTVHTIIIPRMEDMPVYIRNVAHEFYAHTGENPKYLIIGHDVFHKLQWSRSPVTFYVDLDTPEFLGMKLIINPFIDGVIPLGKL